MGQDIVDSQTDVVIVDANVTVRELTARLMRDSGLRVAEFHTIDALSVDAELGADGTVPLIWIDVSRDPSVVIDIADRLPDSLRTADRLVITATRPSLVTTFCPDPDVRPFAHLVERPYSPATMGNVVAGYFDDFELPDEVKLTAQDTDPDGEAWARLGARLVESGEMETVRSIPASSEPRSGSGSVSGRRRAHGSGSGSMPRRERTPRSGSGAIPRREHTPRSGAHEVDILDMSDEAELVEEIESHQNERDGVAADSEGELEVDPIDIADPESELVSVDIMVEPLDDDDDLDDLDNLVSDDPDEPPIEVVSQLDLDLVDRPDEPLVASPQEAGARASDEGSGPKPRETDAEVDESPSTDVGQPVGDESGGSDVHRAATRVAPLGNLGGLENATLDVAADEIEELPEEYVLSLEQPRDVPASARSEADLESVPPPAPSVPANLVEELHIDASAGLMHVADALRHMRRRGIQGLVRTASANLSALIYVDMRIIRWIELLRADGAPVGLANFLVGSGLVDENTAVTLATDVDGGARPLPELCAERGIATAEAVVDAMHWHATRLLWDVLARIDTQYRVTVQLESDELAVLNARPGLRIGVESALFEFYRRFPDRVPPLPTFPGIVYITDQAVSHRFSRLGFLPGERWVLDCLAEPRTVDGLLELAADSGQDVDLTLATLARLRDFGLVVELPRER